MLIAEVLINDSDGFLECRLTTCGFVDKNLILVFMKLTGSGFRKSLSQICVCDATFIIQNQIFYQNVKMK
jgi:hypothetical protein